MKFEMKKIILLFAIILTATTAKAQKHEFSIGYGFQTAMNIDNSIGDSFVGGLFGLNLDEKFSGSFNFEYMYNFAPKMAVGMVVGYEHASIKNVDFKEDYLMIMPAFRMSWIQQDIFKFYSKVAVGFRLDKSSIEVTGTKESDTDVAFGYQIAPLGFEIGNTFAGFAEIGYGCQGIALVGVRYKF